MVGTTTTMSLVVDPPKLHEFMMNIGVKKAHMKPYKMILMGMMSGFYVMIGAHGMISLLSGDEHNSQSVILLSGLVFALALMGILLVGGELFTGNCLLIVAVLSKRIRWWEMLIDWAIIYFSNFAGNILFSVLIFGTGYYGWDASDNKPHANTLCALVHKKTDVPAYQLFFRGIFANFCVCLAVLMAWSASSVEGKVISMLWPIAIFVVSGYEHSIANQGLFTLATIVNCPTPHGWYWVNLAVTTPGNIVGAFIIGITYYFITIWGTDLSLARHPIYAEDGITICDYCKTPCCMASAINNESRNNSFLMKNGAPIVASTDEEDAKNRDAAAFGGNLPLASASVNRAGSLPTAHICPRGGTCCQRCSQQLASQDFSRSFRRQLVQFQTEDRKANEKEAEREARKKVQNDSLAMNLSTRIVYSAPNEDGTATPYKRREVSSTSNPAPPDSGDKNEPAFVVPKE